MAEGRSLKPMFNFHSEATLQKRFKTPESRKAAAKTNDRAAKLMKQIAADLAADLVKAKPSERTLDLEPEGPKAFALKHATAKAHERFDNRRAAIIKARDSELTKIERKQFMPQKRHATPEQEERFKSWARDKRTELRQRQADQKTALSQVQKQAVERVAAKGAKVHGPKKEALQQQLKEIEARRNGASGLRGVLYKAAGYQEKDEALSKSATAAISEIDRKLHADKTNLQDTQNLQTHMMESRHVKEVKDLEYGIAKAKELSEDFNFSASDRYYTLSDVFAVAAEHQSGRDGREGRSMTDPGPTKPA